MSVGVRLAIFTICSNNYIPVARTFLQSARRYHPEADLFICLADRIIEMPGLYDPGWTVVEAERLSVPDFRSFAFRYDIMELNTAVKPYMFRHLLEDLNYAVALYFDPDIEIFRPLEGVIAALCGGASFVLTPHLCGPCEDSEEPNDITIMRAGVYNLGFLGVAGGDESARIIAWWARRLRFHCISAQEQGIFVDQKFMDLVPGFSEHVCVSHDPTLNVAYWNLRQRQLDQEEDNWLVDGHPLTFFHYSGFDPRRPARLSKYESTFDGAMPEPLRKITAQYAAKLLSNGYGCVPESTYAYGRFASGTIINPLVRQMFRQWHRIWPDDPFETYEAFLHEPWPGASRRLSSHLVTNFMKFLYDRFPSLNMRLDLRNAEHVRELVDWYVMHAPSELLLDLRLVEPAAARVGMHRDPRIPHRPAPRSGKDITVVGYLRTASGVGEVGRQTLLTLGAGGLAVEGCDVGLNVAALRNDESCAALLVETGTAPVQIFNVNADQLRQVVEHVRPRLRADAVRINIPFWELSRFPEAWLVEFEQMDEIWAPSRFIQTALAGRIDKPVIYMPIAIELTPPDPLPRERFGLPNSFLFFYAFDFLSFPERKNPIDVIAAFRMAFARSRRAGLVLKCMNGSLVPEKLTALLAEIDGDRDIFLIDETLNRADTLGLIAASDAIVSLHRSEGLGLLIAEGMLLGKPVIATAYSASGELVTAATGYPVGYRLVRVREGEYPFAQGQVWAAPDVAHAAWLMRRLQEEPRRAAPLVAQASRYLQQHHSRTRVAELQVQRLRHLMAAGG
jgi:glycosyltransferase involved in cell wall biosynthesis